MAKGRDIVVGLDIGTTKICTIIGEFNENNQIDIIGVGTHPSKGLRKGVVVNIDNTVEAVKKATQEAEHMAGLKVESVFAGIAGGHIKGINSRGVIAVSGKNKEISQADINRVIEAAKAIALPLDREVLHILPQEFSIDDQDGIKNPMGMSGTRLEAEVHIVTGAVTSAQNIVKCVQRAGLGVNDIVLEQLASSEATLMADEKELGVVLIDIGGGTTDLAVFAKGSIWHTQVIALGGDNITSDISVGLRTPIQEAEEIKRKYGCTLSSLIEEGETIEVPSVGGRPPRVLSRHMLCEIIQPRVEEIFTIVDRELKKAGYEDLPGGAVITGGAAIMEGIPELAEQIFDMPVRRGLPLRIGGLVDIVNNPMYATGVGLVLYGTRNRTHKRFARPDENGALDKVMGRMKEWFREFM